jgi:hypothetical protein
MKMKEEEKEHTIHTIVHKMYHGKLDTIENPTRR